MPQKKILRVISQTFGWIVSRRPVGHDSGRAKDKWHPAALLRGFTEFDA